MNTRIMTLTGLLFVLAAASVASAEIVRVELHGSIEFNVFINGPLAAPVVQEGDPVVVAFNLDSNVFLDSPSPTCHTRGYRFIDGSFYLRIGGVEVAITQSLPEIDVPYFLLRDNDPGADGVLFANAEAICAQGQVDVPIDLPGATGAPFGLNFLRTFDDGNSPNTVFNSYDILENEGYWAFEWMSSFDFGVNGGGGTPLGISYEWFTITRLSAPVITQQPTPVQVCPGGTATFSVAAINAESFLWRQNGSPLVDGPDGNGGIVSGATTATLQIQNIAAGHAGSYDCTASNGPEVSLLYVNVTSDAADLTFWNSCSAGDMTCDQTVDASDVPGFIQALLTPGTFTACNLGNADTNIDGTIDGRDVEPFVQLLIP